MVAKEIGGVRYDPPLPPNKPLMTWQGAFVLAVVWPVVVAVAVGLFLVNALSTRARKQFASVLIPFSMSRVDKLLAPCRRELLKEAKGRVLDVGCATGLYLKYLVTAEKKVSSVVALEPNTAMHPELRANIKKLHAPFDVDVVSHFLEDVKGDGTFDTIILGNVLCEIPDYQGGLREVDRLLKPGGKVIFCEHIAEERGSLMRLLQDSINWWWVVVSDGCNCNRETMASVRKMGWEVAEWTTLQGTLVWTRRFVLGVAVKPTKR